MDDSAVSFHIGFYLTQPSLNTVFSSCTMHINHTIYKHAYCTTVDRKIRKFLNVQEKNEDQLARSCEKWRITQSPGERNIPHIIKRRKANWIGHILRRNCLLKHFIEGKIQERIGRGGVEEDVSSYWMTLRKREDIVKWRRRHQIAFVENSLWKTLCPCRKTDCRLNEWMSLARCGSESSDI